MKEDLFVSSGNGTGVRYDDECSLDGSDENRVNTIEEGDESDESQTTDGSQTTDESDGSQTTDESDGSQTTDESDGSDGSDGSDESQTTDESDESDESDGSDESQTTDGSQTTDESDGSDKEEPDKPYTASKEKAAGKPTTGKGKNEIPKRHRSQRYRGTRGSGGDSATSISPGSFEYHDGDHSSDSASVANNHSPERPSKLHFDSWMPTRDGSLISRGSSSEIEKKLTGDEGRELRRRDGDCLREIKLQSFHVQHIAVGSRGSVRVLARLDKEREMSVWTRTALVEAWGRERADQLLSFYLRFYIKRARARRLPNNKRRKIQQGGNGSMLNWDKEFEELKVRVEGGKQ